MRDLPLIDISALESECDSDRQGVIDAIGRAFHDIGFIAIQGHRIPESDIAVLREQIIRWFDRPVEEKLALSITPDNYRGYIPLAFFTPNAAGPNSATTNTRSQSADQYEAYKLHAETDPDAPICSACSLYGPNKWPGQAPQLKKAVLNYWRECDRVLHTLLDAVADFLGVDPAFFRAAFNKPLTNMTLLHYPKSNSMIGEFGIHPHKDTDVLTILAPDPVGGLFLRPRDSGQWIAADAPPDALIVNVGDMLEIWSGGYFISTPHKVINPADKERYSFPYFAVPRFDIQVEPLGSAKDSIAQQCRSSGFDRPAMQVGEVSAKIWQSNWPDAEPVEQCYDPYTA